MNIEEIRDYALGLNGVTEDQAFGDDIVNFRIEGKIFLCLWLGGGKYDMEDGQPRFALKLAPERNEELRELYPGVMPAYHWNKKHWSDVYLDNGIGDTLLKNWIEESYRLVISKLPKAIREKYK